MMSEFKKQLMFSMLASVAFLASTACGDKGSGASPEPVQGPEISLKPQAKPEPPKKAPKPRLDVRLFASADKALEYVLHKSRPLVVGFGEFHQHTGTVDTLSALKRFTDTMLPVMAARTSDLVVETWVSTGNCGQNEKRVTKDVSEVSKRPEATETETVKLIKKAEALGVQPHVLELQCNDYAKVLVDGGVDYLAMLELVGKRLGEKAKKALVYRDAQKAEKPKEDKKETGAPKMVALYGGAVHNDAEPEETWKTVTFGKELKQFSSERYVEIDLYVPEFIQDSDARAGVHPGQRRRQGREVVSPVREKRLLHRRGGHREEPVVVHHHLQEKRAESVGGVRTSFHAGPSRGFTEKRDADKAVERRRTAIRFRHRLPSRASSVRCR
jgi:hypothetical protein